MVVIEDVFPHWLSSKTGAFPDSLAKLVREDEITKVGREQGANPYISGWGDLLRIE